MSIWGGTRPRVHTALPGIIITGLFLALFGFLFLSTQYLQFVLGCSPSQAGVRVLPYAGAMIVFAPLSARFVILDGSPPDSVRAGELQQVASLLPHASRVVEWRDVADAINEVATELRRRRDEDVLESPAIYLLVFGLQRYRMLRRQEDSFGFSREEALCQSLDIIIPERLRERHWDGYHRMMKTGQSRHKAHEVLSVPALTKSGETLSIQFTVAAVTNAEGALSGIVALLRDATATYEEIKRLRTAK